MNHVTRNRNQSNSFQMYISGSVKEVAAPLMRCGYGFVPVRLFLSRPSFSFCLRNVPQQVTAIFRPARELFLRWNLARIRNMSPKSERNRTVSRNFSIICFTCFLGFFSKLYLTLARFSKYGAFNKLSLGDGT